MAERELNAAFVKKRGKELGADLVGIASAGDPQCVSARSALAADARTHLALLKSVIVMAQRIPAGAFRCKSNVPVQYIDMLVLRKMDKVAYGSPTELEDSGHPSFVVAAQETDGAQARRATAGCRRAISASKPASARSASRSTS